MERAGATPSLRFAVQFSADGTISDSFNVTSVVRTTTGTYTITPATNPWGSGSE